KHSNLYYAKKSNLSEAGIMLIYIDELRSPNRESSFKMCSLTYLLTGEWTGVMPKDSAIYTDNAILVGNECDFKEETHLLKIRPLDVHPAKFYNGENTGQGVNTLEAEVWSSIYGYGLQYSINLHEAYVD
ncbi:unnamed protein product, partial [Owenia fusiformis]